MRNFNIQESQAATYGILNFYRAKLSDQFKTDLQNQKLSILNGSYILRKELEPSKGSQDLVDSNTKKITGVSDFTDKVIQPGEVFICEKIRIGYDTHADSDMEIALGYERKVPASFRSATFRVRQDGKVIFERSIADLMNRYTGTSLKDDYVELDIPFALIGTSKNELEIEFPKGAAAHATLKEYLELSLVGQKVSS